MITVLLGFSLIRAPKNLNGALFKTYHGILELLCSWIRLVKGARTGSEEGSSRYSPRDRDLRLALLSLLRHYT